MSKTILIVEDNKLNMKLFNDILQAQGYNTVQASDGGTFLNLVGERKPDLILMDIRLGKISGVELTKMLKADVKLKEIPVVAVTALAMKKDKEIILECGCDAYVSKPVSMETLLNVVSKFLN